jgi:hypothetical protein
VTSRIGKTEITTWKPVRAQLEDLSGRFDLVIHHHVEVTLLRPLGIWPPRSLMLRCQLERDPRCGVALRYYEPVVTPVGHRQAQKFRIELRERSRVGTVDDHMVKATNHAASFSGPRRRAPSTSRRRRIAIPLRAGRSFQAVRGFPTG